MDNTHEQLRRVLQLALQSPYEGERAKAVALLLQRLKDTDITLAHLDSSFLATEAENRLRERANLPYEFEMTLKSREEALLYHGLLQQWPTASATWVESHRLLCHTSPTTKTAVDAEFTRRAASLQRRLAEAQRQAMQEYNEKRRFLFEQAVEQELQQATL